VDSTSDVEPADRWRCRDVTVRRAQGVEVVFGDGLTHDFPLEELRAWCPCAHCRTTRESGRPSFVGDPGRLTLRDAELVGAWGLRLVWDDGHGTGIFPWDELRRWADAGTPRFGPNSGLGA